MSKMPTTAELTALALETTDFVAEAADAGPGRETQRAATIATAQAAETWEEANGLPIGETITADVLAAVALALVDVAILLANNEASAAADALADAIEAGDVDADGAFIPYDTYRSAA